MKLRLEEYLMTSEDVTPDGHLFRKKETVITKEKVRLYNHSRNKPIMDHNKEEGGLHMSKSIHLLPHRHHRFAVLGLSPCGLAALRYVMMLSARTAGMCVCPFHLGGVYMARFAVLLIILVSFVGCSLVDPFVTRKKPAPPPLTESVSLTDAFDYAAKVKDAYRSALRDQACLQSWLGIGLVPLTAAAIGLGATGSSANTVLSLGLAGTSALGIGTWLYNKPRQLAWVAGLKAVTCAEDAMEPLNFSSSARTDLDTNLDGLRVGLQTLDQKTAKLETEADKAKALREAANTDKPEISSAVRALQSLETSARAELEELKALKTAAEAALTNGAELKQTLTIAGGRLVVAVKKITDEVDSIVVDTQRDPQALTNIIAGLGSTYGTLTSVPKGIAPQVAKDKASKRFASR
jgi:hypothetical protein